MNKILDATCQSGVVKDSDNTVIEGAEIQSEGVASSSGIAIIQKGKVVYFAKTSGDLKTVIEKIITGLQNIDVQFTAMSAYGGAACNVSLISELTALKDALK